MEDNHRSPRGMKSELDLNRAEGKSWNYRKQTQKAHLFMQHLLGLVQFQSSIYMRICLSPPEIKLKIHVNAQTDSINTKELLITSLKD